MMATMTMMAAVAVGGAIGAVLRYNISPVTGARIFGVNGPLATLFLNGVGSALVGCLAGSIVPSMVLPEAWRGLLVVGVLVALTTISSFTLDAGQLC